MVEMARIERNRNRSAGLSERTRILKGSQLGIGRGKMVVELGQKSGGAPKQLRRG